MDTEQQTRDRVAAAFAAQRQDERLKAARLPTAEILSRLQNSPSGTVHTHAEVSALIDELAHRIEHKVVPGKLLVDKPHSKPATTAVVVRPPHEVAKGGAK